MFLAGPPIAGASGQPPSLGHGFPTGLMRGCCPRRLDSRPRLGLRGWGLPSPRRLCSPPVSLQVNAEGSVDSVFSQVCTHLDALK